MKVLIAVHDSATQTIKKWSVTPPLSSDPQKLMIKLCQSSPLNSSEDELSSSPIPIMRGINENHRMICWFIIALNLTCGILNSTLEMNFHWHLYYVIGNSKNIKYDITNKTSGLPPWHSKIVPKQYPFLLFKYVQMVRLGRFLEMKEFVTCKILKFLNNSMQETPLHVTAHCCRQLS